MRSEEHDIRDGGRPETPPPEPEAQDAESDPAVTGEEPEGAEPSDASEQAERVEHDIEKLLARARERDEYLALAQRVQADFENYRKRAARDVGAAEQRGLARLARELLPAVDNLDRALSAVPADAPGPDAKPAGGDASTIDQLLSGIRLVRSELGTALERVGIEAFSPAGERFDPTIHEAMAQVPADDVASGHVVEVFQAGYRIDSTVIRPARVVVAA